MEHMKVRKLRNKTLKKMWEIRRSLMCESKWKVKHSQWQITAKKQEEHEILKSKKNGEEVEQSLVVSITIRERKTIL